MAYLTNIDFVSVGVAIAGNLILGFLILFNNRKSATGILFLLQTIILSTWSALNYLTYKITAVGAALWIERLVMFFAIPNSIIFLMLMYTIPDATFRMGKKFFWGLVALGAVAMAAALSPFVFSAVKVIPGVITPEPVIGPGIFLFALAAVLTIPIGIYFLIKRYIKTGELEKLQLKYVVVGVVTMFGFILVFDFIFPTIFGSSEFIPFSAVFTLPFVVFTAYAIFKHHLLNTKVIATEGLTFVLSIFTLFEVLTSGNIFDFILRIIVFLLVLVFGILLIESVLREVEQREELEQLNAKIAAQNQQLEDLSRFKSQLLSLASHQIKSPLAAIKGFASLIADGSYGEVGHRVKEKIVKIQRSADDLIGLINTLLDVRKVEEGKMEYKFEKVNLTEMVAKTVDLLQPLAAAKQLKLTFESAAGAAPTAPIFVSADPEKFKQVIQNLVDNAIKYTPSGFVKVELTGTAAAPAGAPASASVAAAASVGAATAAVASAPTGTATFSVSDSGLGVSAELIPHLFEEFVRDERVKKEIRGTGLGLYIARKIVEAHGGKLWAESPGEGKGSTFKVSLPEVG